MIAIATITALEQRKLKEFLKQEVVYGSFSHKPNNKRAKDGLKDCLLSLKSIDEYDSDKCYDVEMM